MSATGIGASVKRKEDHRFITGKGRAIMPHVDEFRPVHSLNSLQDLAETLASPRRDTHDPKRWMKHG